MNTNQKATKGRGAKVPRRPAAAKADNLDAAFEAKLGAILAAKLDALGAKIYDRICGEVGRMINEALDNLDERLKATDEKFFDVLFALDGLQRSLGGTFSPFPAIGADYKETPNGYRLEPDTTSADEVLGNLVPHEEYLAQYMEQTADLAESIENLFKSSKGGLLAFLNEKCGEVVRKLLYYPRIAIATEVKIGALQLFREITVNRTAGTDNEAEIDAEARAPFDRLLNATTGLLRDEAGKRTTTYQKALARAGEALNAFAAKLEVCQGGAGCADAREVSDAATAALDAARIARDILAADPTCAELARLAKEVKGIRARGDKSGLDSIIEMFLKANPDSPLKRKKPSTIRTKLLPPFLDK